MATPAAIGAIAGPMQGDGIPALLTALSLQPPDSRGTTMFQQILCPVDFSDASCHAAQYAIALARQHSSVLTVLHVPRSSSVPAALPQFEPTDMRLAESRKLATEAAALFESATQAGVRVEVLIECGQPARQILTRAAALPADVIVMGAHGAGGFEHLMLGSIAEKVLRKATCPVFTVPEQAAFTPGATFKKIVCAIDFSDWSLAARSGLHDRRRVEWQRHGDPRHRMAVARIPDPPSRRPAT